MPAPNSNDALYRIVEKLEKIDLKLEGYVARIQEIESQIKSFKTILAYITPAVGTIALYIINHVFNR